MAIGAIEKVERRKGSSTTQVLFGGFFLSLFLSLFLSPTDLGEHVEKIFMALGSSLDGKSVQNNGGNHVQKISGSCFIFSKKSGANFVEFPL